MSQGERTGRPGRLLRLQWRRQWLPKFFPASESGGRASDETESGRGQGCRRTRRVVARRKVWLKLGWGAKSNNPEVPMGQVPVVVCTYRRSEVLKETLTGLCAKKDYLGRSGVRTSVPKGRYPIPASNEIRSWTVATSQQSKHQLSQHVQSLYGKWFGAIQCRRCRARYTNVDGSGRGP